MPGLGQILQILLICSWSGLLVTCLEFSIIFQMELSSPQSQGPPLPYHSVLLFRCHCILDMSPPPLLLPNTYSQWVPVCSEHPSLAQHSWSGPSFSILQALLLASENLEAEVLGKAVAVSVVQLQRPGQFGPMKEKPSKCVNTVLHQALWQSCQKNVTYISSSFFSF